MASRPIGESAGTLTSAEDRHERQTHPQGDEGRQPGGGPGVGPTDQPDQETDDHRQRGRGDERDRHQRPARRVG